MKFRVPLAYEVTGVPKGKRNPVTEQFWQFVEIDIPVLDDGEAPVAVVWDDSFPSIGSHLFEADRWRALSPVPEDGIQVVRQYNDGYLIRHHGCYDAAKFAEMLSKPTSTRFFGTDHIWYRAHGAEKPLKREDFREDKELSCNFEQQYALLTERASNFFFAGGELFTHTSEPVVIMTSLETGEHGITTLPRIVPRDRVFEREPKKRGNIMYSIDRWHEVADMCDEDNLKYSDYKTRRGKDARPTLVDRSRAPEVHIVPQAKVCVETLNLVDSARRYILGVSEYQRLHDVEPHYGIAFLQMRIALANWETTGDVEDLAIAVQHMVDSYPREVDNSNLIAALNEFNAAPVDISETPIGLGM